MTFAEISTAAEKFILTLQDRSAEIEEGRRLPADLAKKMATAGLFRLLTPQSLGGYEVSPGEFSQILQTVSYGDASAGWCVMIADTAALVGAYLEPGIARDIFANPEVILAGIFAPMGKATEEGDNFRVSGRWQWASGSANCHWVAGGAMIMEDGKPRLLSNGMPENRMMIFPDTDVELIDTWHASGLKGTGSGDMAVTDVLVPRARSVSLISDKPTAEGALYVFPVFGLLALGIASVAVGNARAALDDIINLAGHKKGQGAAKSIANRPVVQAEVSKAEAQWSAACAFLSECTEENWRAAQELGILSETLRARLRLACTHATRTSAEVCRVAYDLGGGNSVFLSSSLQRRFRDAHTMTQHLMVSPAIYEQSGRIFLGLETNTAML